MENVKTIFSIQDQMSNALKSMTRICDRLQDSVDSTKNSANALGHQDFFEIRRSISDAVNLIDRMGDELNNADKETQNLQRSANGAKASFSSLSLIISGIESAINLASKAIGALTDAFNLADKVVSTKARIDNMNNALIASGKSAFTTAEVTDKIFEAAQRARGSYIDMADAVAKFGNNAGRAFNNVDELIKFTENVQTAFAVGGADIQSASGAMLQLTQAMAAGALRGEELNSVLEGAPQIARAIERYMGIAEGSIKNVASEGLVTSEVVKNAVLSMSESLQADFANIPTTFGQAMTSLQNIMMRTAEPLFDEMLKVFSSEAFQNLTDNLVTAFENAIPAITGLIQYIIKALEILSPVIVEIGSAISELSIMSQPFLDILFDILGTLSGTFISLLDSALSIIKSLAPAMLIVSEIVKDLVDNFAPILEKAGELIAKLVDNLAPILETILSIIKSISDGLEPVVRSAFTLLTAVSGLLDIVKPLFDVVNELIKIAKPFLDIVPILLQPITILLDIISGVILTITGNTEKLGETWNRVWDGMVKFAQDCINWIIDSLNFLFGWAGVAIERVSWSAADKVQQEIDKGIGPKENFGQNDLLKQMFETDKKQREQDKRMQEIVDSVNIVAGNTGGGGSLKSVGKIEEDVNIAEEDLQFMKDVAEMRYIQNFVQLSPSVTMNSNISENIDIDRVVSQIEFALEDQFARTAQGVYA